MVLRLGLKHCEEEAAADFGNTGDEVLQQRSLCARICYCTFSVLSVSTVGRFDSFLYLRWSANCFQLRIFISCPREKGSYYACVMAGKPRVLESFAEWLSFFTPNRELQRM